MSSQSVTNNGKQLHVKTDTSKIFIWDNRYKAEPYNNSAYDAVTLKAGTVMGRVTGTGYIKPLRSTYSDGAEIPVGILAEDVEVAGGALTNLQICNYGDVVEDKLIFDLSTDNLDTTVSSQRLRDRIHNVGIRLISNTEMTDYDN
ncbi:MAG TPA: head decoration protein [Flavobacteriales bacterium]|nr:head decoration protein [Flavobacteriales bacterium]